jgi:hypothetical protein
LGRTAILRILNLPIDNEDNELLRMTGTYLYLSEDK